MAAFGIMFYGFSVYLTDEAAGSEFSTTVLSLAYSGAALVSAPFAMPVGRYADQHGVRSIVGLGSVLVVPWFGSLRRSTRVVAGCCRLVAHMCRCGRDNWPYLKHTSWARMAQDH